MDLFAGKSSNEIFDMIMESADISEAELSLYCLGQQDLAVQDDVINRINAFGAERLPSLAEIVDDVLAVWSNNEEAMLRELPKALLDKMQAEVCVYQHVADAKGKAAHPLVKAVAQESLKFSPEDDLNMLYSIANAPAIAARMLDAPQATTAKEPQASHQAPKPAFHHRVRHYTM